MSMEKKEIRVYVVNKDYYDVDITIGEFINALNAAAEMGATHICIDDSDDEYPHTIMQLYYKRIETDEELNKRIEFDNMMKEVNERHERKEYERLKKKFS